MADFLNYISDSLIQKGARITKEPKKMYIYVYTMCTTNIETVGDFTVCFTCMKNAIPW